MTAVTPPDLELWLTAYVRARIPNVSVSNKEPPNLSLPLAKPLIVIRDDSGPRTEIVTFDRSVGVSVLAGSRMNDKPANDLARIVAGLLFDDAIAFEDSSPIAGVVYSGCNGPYAVEDQLDVARRYLTVQYTVMGEF